MTDTSAQDDLIACLPAVRAFSLSLTRNRAEADDLMQDTIMKAWANLDKFQVGTNMRAWLFTIARNTFYTTRKKAGREVADVDNIFTEAVAVKPDHDGRLQMRDFRAAFGQLSDEHREALILVGANGFSYDDAGEMCGVPAGTMKSRVNRGRQKLADLLDLQSEDVMELTDAATQSIVNNSRGPQGT